MTQYYSPEGLSSEAKLVEGFLYTGAERTLKAHVVQAIVKETWTILPRCKTSKVVRIGTFQYLKGCHEDQIELFFETLAGRTRSSHFISALKQDVPEVASFL